MICNRIAIRLVVFVLVSVLSGAAVFSGSASGNNEQTMLPAVMVWQQANSSGFGDPGIQEVTALAVFKNELYAATYNPIEPDPLYDGAQIFRSPDGVNWTSLFLPGFGNTHDIAPPAILDLTVYNGYLYASTGWGDGPGQIHRSLTGNFWAPILIHGFNNQDNVDITTLIEFNGKLYAGVRNLVSGAQIWSSFTGDSNSWTQAAPQTPGSAPSGVTGMAEFNGDLYALIESESPAEIWSTSGSTWSTVMDNGFGDAKTVFTGGLVVFGGYLYAGAGNAMTGALLFRTHNGVDWTQANQNAFNDSNNVNVEEVFVYQNHLYASVKNNVSGLELWQSTDGLNWDQVNQDGFGNAGNTGSNWGNAQAIFDCRLYFGTLNIVNGGELWRTGQPCLRQHLPFISH